MNNQALVDELETNLGGGQNAQQLAQQLAQQRVGGILLGATPEERQEIMIPELIDVNANSVAKLNALKADIEKSNLTEQVKNNLYQSINFRLRVEGNAQYLQQQVNQVQEPLAPITPQSFREYVEPQMLFTRSIITKGVHNAMRYLP